MLIAHAYCFRASRRSETHSSAKISGVKRGGTSIINASADFRGSEYFVPEASIAIYFFRKYVRYSFSSVLPLNLIFLFFFFFFVSATSPCSNFKYLDYVSLHNYIKFNFYKN